MSNKSIKKGFTLIEVLMVVAILGILFGVGTIAISTIRDSLAQNKVDSIARQIYVTAQENFTKMKNSGTDDSIKKNGLVDYESPTAQEVDYPLYYVTSNNENIKSLVPDGIFDFDENCSYVIEYDPVNCVVTSVFYSEDANINNYYTGEERISLRSFSYRKKFAKENGFHVGFYGDGDDTGHGNDSENRLKLNLYVDNGEDLLLTYTITNVPQKYSESDITLEIEYEGKESHAIYSQKIVSKTRKGEYILDHFNNTVNVDPDENNNKSFNKLFNGGLLANGKKTTNGISFILGEDIEVRAIAHIGSDDETTSSPITKTFNSLFASVSGSGNNRTAYISYARHLQNLDNCLDNATFAVGTAIQNKDIVIPTNSNTKEVYKFMPIVNNNLYCYEGNGHTISNVYITTTNSAKQEATGAGLFGRFGNIGKDKNYIKDLSLIDTVVLCDNANSGSLVGNITTSLELINVGSYLQNVDIEHEPSIYISGNNAGGLIGYAANGLTVDRCFAATVVKATGKYSSEEALNGYAGGFVGISAKPSTYTNSYADSYVRGDVVGGFAGKTDGSSFESCYTVGFNYGSSVMAAGFTPSKNITGVNSYTAFLYGVADYQYSTYISGTANQVCYLIDLSTENAIGTEVEADVLTDKTRLQTNLGNGNFTLSNATKSHPYNFNYGTLKVYPYPTINSIDHYGDWDSDNDGMPQTGFFYWEYESGGAKPGYNYYMIFSDGTSPIDTLYKGHDDGGVITEYGYGFIIKSQKYYDGCFTWDKYSNGSKATQNGVASEAIRKQLTNPNTYKVVAYNTMNAANDGGRFDKANWHASDTFQETDYTDYIITTKDLILASSKQCTTVTLKGLGSQKTETYTFNPFFAADMVAGDEDDYIAAYRGANRTNDHQIRCIEQLQYINWNYSELNCHTLCDATISDDYLLNWTRFTFLYDMGLDTSLISNWKRSGYLQTHDIDASGFNYTPIAAMGSVVYTTNGINIAVLKTVDSILPSSSLYVYDWFGDDYNGQSYLIKDLTISTNAYTIGIFGTTIGANLENIILYSENGATITRTSGVPNGLGSIVPISDYFIGGIVGLCSDGSSLTKFSDGSLVTGVIDNCAVGGYKINDYTSQASTTGSSAVGGLVGSSTVRIKNCSADVDIYVNSTSTFGDIAVGGLAGSVSTNTFDDTISAVIIQINASSKDINDYIEALKSYATVYNCYSAGSIAFSHDCRFGSVATKRYVVAGLIGTTLNTKVFNVINAGGTFNYPVGILNCYTFMDLPERQTADNIQSIGGMIAKIELNGSLYYSSWLLNDYVYSGKGYDFISGSQFVESQSNVVVDENITGKLLGTVDSLSYNDMTQKRSKSPSTTTAVKTYDCGFDCGSSYPFVAVLKRGNTPIAASRWPASTQIILQKDGGSGGFSYYVAPNSKASDLNISTIQGYLTKAGYTLEGYYYNNEKVINSDGSFVSTSSFFTNGEWNKGNGTYTFVGKWNIIKYTIKLNTPNSKVLINSDYQLWKTIEYTVESPTFTLPYPEKDGLTFVGWKHSITGNSLKDVVIKKGTTGDLEYNAVFGENVYNITYHGLEGATLSKENPTTYRYIQTITLNNPEKYGYEFVGWKGTNIDGTKTNVTWTLNKGDKEFTAVWKAKEGTLTYQYNDGKTANKSINFNYESDITVENPTRDYYKFDAWYIKWGSSELKVEGGTKMPHLWGDIVLSAKWNPIYYKVTYVLNYNNIVDTQKDAYSVVYDNYKLITPDARTGYRFMGWYDNKELSGTPVEYIPTGSHGDKTFYARWVQEYTITYNCNGGSLSGSYKTKYVKGESFNLPTPTNGSYLFDGWYDSNGNKVEKITSSMSGNITLNARWAIQITMCSSRFSSGSSSGQKYNVTDKKIMNYSYNSSSKVATIGSLTLSRSEDSVLFNKANWELVGWCLSNGTQVFNANGTPYNGYNVTSSLTVYPIWRNKAINNIWVEYSGTTLAANTFYLVLSNNDSHNNSYYALTKKDSYYWWGDKIWSIDSKKMIDYTRNAGISDIGVDTYKTSNGTSYRYLSNVSTNVSGIPSVNEFWYYTNGYLDFQGSYHLSTDGTTGYTATSNNKDFIKERVTGLSYSSSNHTLSGSKNGTPVYVNFSNGDFSVNTTNNGNIAVYKYVTASSSSPLVITDYEKQN